MPSTFTWLDTSEHDRRRAMEVIDLFRRQTTRDELGIGAVRDALAELLTPGISTIQTRARYFLIIPWIYQRLERRRVRSADVAYRARGDEIRLAEALGASDDPAGTIGIEAGSHLQRLASNVYWGGLGRLGIRLFPGSQDQYHRSLDRFYRASSRAAQLREDPEGQVFGSSNWHPHIPDAPEDLLPELSFSLTQDEARYLQDRFQARAAQSLMACLSREADVWQDVRFPWDESLFERYPEPLRTWVHHARCFSEVIQGAALLYNWMLASALPREDWIADYDRRMAEWQALVAEREEVLRSWDREAFWKIVLRQEPRIARWTRPFAEGWISMVLDRRVVPTADEAQRLIRERERRLKGGRARLLHREYLEIWGGASGTEPLDYRWGVAQTVTHDILRGLHGEEDRARAA